MITRLSSFFSIRCKLLIELRCLHSASKIKQQILEDKISSVINVKLINVKLNGDNVKLDLIILLIDLMQL